MLVDYVELPLKIATLYFSSPLYRSLFIILISLFAGLTEAFIFDFGTIKFVDFLGFFMTNAGLIIFYYKKLK